MNSRFTALLHREWLQHRRGWLVLMVAPASVLGLLSLFEGALQIQVGAQSADVSNMTAMPALLQASLMTLAVGLVTLALAVLSVLFQLPGLARRDQDDRSIDFWRAMPVSDTRSVAATLLSHVLVFPWAALVAGLLGGVLSTALLVGTSHGLMAWLDLPWATLLPSVLALLLRLSVGLVLALLWLSPLLMGAMLASAALRRWGVPVLAAVLFAATRLLDPRLPVPLVQPALKTMGSEALQALVRIDAFSALEHITSAEADAVLNLLQTLPAGLWQDTIATAAQAATPGFALAVLGGALGFASLAAMRRRHG